MANEAAETGRRAIREITGALGLSVVLLAFMVAAVLVADRDVVAAVGVLALATALGVGVLVTRRVARMAADRTETIESQLRGREQLERTLSATRRLVEIDSPLELRRQICHVAREVFGCDAVSLWEVEPDHILLLERVPWVHPYSGADRRPIAELPGLRRALDDGQPLFVPDLREVAAGVTRATAEILETGSLLNMPIAYGGIARLDIVLSWNAVLPAPGETQLVAVQRFADQAGLALEQSRYRIAQAEIASLNRTLSRMVQTAPLFHAGGTQDEVAEAVCSEALAIFEADGAALWLDGGDCIELLHRAPGAGVFEQRQRILFAEHPGFAGDVAGGQPHFLADVEREDPVLWERFGRHNASRSQLRLPLASSGHARALIVLSWSDPVPPPSAEVSAVASRFADQAGVAMAEAARREAERGAAALHARFEESLLPSIVMESPGLDVATFYRPGDDRLSLGGDFYDCLELGDGSIALLIGDVAGHGPAAAALGAGLRSAWRALVLGGWALADVARGMQSVCVSERQDPYLFVTAIIARIPADRRTLEFVSAGHPAPLVAGTPEAPEEHNGPPLGIVDDAAWHVVTVPLEERATVLLYTDGLVEGRARPHTSERLGVEAVQRQLAGVAPGAFTEEDLAALVALATEAHGAGLPDDVAMLALNVRRAG